MSTVQMKQANENIAQTFTSADTSKAIIDALITPVETQIKQTGAAVEGWNTFSAMI